MSAQPAASPPAEELLRAPSPKRSADGAFKAMSIQDQDQTIFEGMEKALKIKANFPIGVLNSVLETMLIHASCDDTEKEQIQATPHDGHYFVTASDAVNLHALLMAVGIVPDRATPLDQRFVETYMGGNSYGLTSLSSMTVEIIHISELPPTHVRPPRIVDLNMIRLKISVPPQSFATTKSITEEKIGEFFTKNYRTLPGCNLEIPYCTLLKADSLGGKSDQVGRNGYAMGIKSSAADGSAAEPLGSRIPGPDCQLSNGAVFKVHLEPPDRKAEATSRRRQPTASS